MGRKRCQLPGQPKIVMQVFSTLFPLHALTRARNRQGIERTQLSLIAKDQLVCQMSGLETATTRLPPRPDVVTKKLQAGLRTCERISLLSRKRSPSHAKCTVARLIASELVHRCGGSDGIVLRRTIFPINPGSVDPRAPVAPRAKLPSARRPVKAGVPAN